MYKFEAQTAKELIGKWKLVSWKDMNGNPKDIQASMGTTEVYQVFEENKDFESLVGGAVHKGSWSLADDNKHLTIKSGLFTTKFSVDSFDSKKRVLSAKGLGVFEYTKQ